MAKHEIKVTVTAILEIEADDLAHACVRADDFGDEMAGVPVPLYLADCVKMVGKEVSLTPDSENTAD